MSTRELYDFITTLAIPEGAEDEHLNALQESIISGERVVDHSAEEVPPPSSYHSFSPAPRGGCLPFFSPGAEAMRGRS